MRVIPLSELEADLQGTLAEFLDSGKSLVVELPDHRLVSIWSLEPDDDDPLVEKLLESNTEFRALVERSKASERVPFPVEPYACAEVGPMARTITVVCNADPPSFEPTHCTTCATMINLGEDGYAMTAAGYLCEACAEEQIGNVFGR